MNESNISLFLKNSYNKKLTKKITIKDLNIENS